MRMFALARGSVISAIPASFADPDADFSSCLPASLQPSSFCPHSFPSPIPFPYFFFPSTSSSNPTTFLLTTPSIGQAVLLFTSPLSTPLKFLYSPALTLS